MDDIPYRDSSRSLHEKIARQKKLEQAQLQTMMDVYSHYQMGTFLSLDIVGSTKLKEGEDSVVVVDSFKAFHSFIVAHISKSISSVISGDGVMCMFKTPHQAVTAALNIYRELERFNKNQSRLKRYINVRMGINTGSVLVEETTDLGRLTERSIDIAGHFQKYAKPGQLLISKSTLEGLSQKNEFTRRWKSIDNTIVYQHMQNFSPTAKNIMQPSFIGIISRFLNKSADGLITILQLFGVMNFFRLFKLPLLILGGLALGTIVLTVTLYNNSGIEFSLLSPKQDNVSSITSEDLPTKARIVNSKIRYTKSWHHLGDAKIKIGDTWQDIPKTVYLVIPPGKNSKNNLRIGVFENTVTVLKQGWFDTKYYTSKWGLGIFKQYVETYDGYYIFVDRKEAERFLTQIMR